MTLETQKRLLDFKARQEAGEHLSCPRCGKDAMKPELYTNALSRVFDIMVCDACYPRKTVIRGNIIREPSTLDYSE